jgi:hypothetical protein
MAVCEYTMGRLGRSPRGRSCNAWRLSLSPLRTARESDLTARGLANFPNTILMQEGGRIELHRVSPRLTAYKAVSTPNGLHLPYQMTDALRRHRSKTGGRDQIRTGGGGMQLRCLTRFGYPASRSNLSNRHGYVGRKSTGHVKRFNFGKQFFRKTEE